MPLKPFPRIKKNKIITAFPYTFPIVQSLMFLISQRYNPPIPYRYFVASRLNPELQSILNIHPLGVSGVCVCNDHVLVGTRDMGLSSYPGYLELVPSGSIETRACLYSEIDFLTQVVWELEEEARIYEDKVTQLHPLGLFYSKDIEVYDLGVMIKLSLDNFEQNNFETTKEYPLLNWIKVSEWQKMASDPSKKIVPLSRVLSSHINTN